MSVVHCYMLYIVICLLYIVICCYMCVVHCYMCVVHCYMCGTSLYFVYCYMKIRTRRSAVTVSWRRGRSVTVGTRRTARTPAVTPGTTASPLTRTHSSAH